MAQSLFKHLVANTQSRITVLAPAWSQPVLDRMPEVNESVEMAVGHGSLGLRERYRLAKQLRGRFQHAIVLPGSLKSALVPFFARIPKRTGFVGEQRYGLLNDIRKLDKTALPLHVQRVVALGLETDAAPVPLEKISPPLLQMNQQNRDAMCERFDIDQDKPIIALCPGAEFGPAKQWPLKHFRAIAEWAGHHGRQVLIMGSARDTGDGEVIAADLNHVFNLAGKTGLGDAIDLMSLADHVVTNDSGLMHIASALGCRVVALYGSSSNTYTPPLASDAVSLSIDIDCRPCFKRTCPLGHTNCLNQLLPERVIAELQ